MFVYIIVCISREFTILFFQNLDIVSKEAGKRTNPLKCQSNSRLSSIYLDESVSDVTFVCGPEDCDNPENVPAHRLVLAMHSPVFKTMFFGSIPEKPIIRLTDATGEGFREFLEVFYKDEVNPTIENAAEVIYLLKKYELHERIDFYSEFLQRTLTKDDMGYCFELAMRFDLLELKDFCGSKIVTDENGSEVFNFCSKNVMETILQQEELKQYGKEVFLGCFQWARNAIKLENDTKNEPTLSEIRDQMSTFFDLIEFGSMDSDVIKMMLYEFNELFTRKDFATIHMILASKYSRTIDDSPFAHPPIIEHLDYDFDSSFSHQKNSISKNDVISFQSREKILFYGYKYARPIQNDLGVPYNLWLTLTKKSSDKENNIVLLRKRLEIIPKLSVITDKLEKVYVKKLIMIEPNVNYEVRVMPSHCVAEKYYTHFRFVPKVSDQVDDSIVSIEGSSPVISGLLFEQNLK